MIQIASKTETSPQNELKIAGLIVRDLNLENLDRLAVGFAKAFEGTSLEATVERLLGKIVQLDDIFKTHAPELVARITARRQLAKQGIITYPVQERAAA